MPRGRLNLLLLVMAGILCQVRGFLFHEKSLLGQRPLFRSRCFEHKALRSQASSHLNFQNNKNVTSLELSDRRSALMALAAALPIGLLPPRAHALADAIDQTIILDNSSSNTTTATANGVVSAPLEFIPSLNAYVVHFTLFGERFGAILDTGSPFLTVPSTCTKRAYKYIWGCYHPELTRNSGYSNTVEAFDNYQGTVVWRKAAFSFEQEEEQDMVFGVLGPQLMDGPGGVTLGLIKQTDKRVRPSFLGQTGYQSFCVDLRGQENQSPQLVLSRQSMIPPNEDYIPLVQDLNRRFKAPVVHYTARVGSFVVNGLTLGLSHLPPAYVIFDTGVTGMIVDQEVFDGRYMQARKNKEKSLWGHVEVTFTTQQGKEVKLEATKPLTSPLGNLKPWPRFKGILIVLGLAFLDGKAMTIDVDEGKLQFSD